MNEEEFRTYCEDYFKRLKQSNDVVYNSDAANARDKNAKKARSARKFTVIGRQIKSEGPDVTADAALDQAIKKAFNAVPKPSGSELKKEYHFLMYRKGSIYQPSKYFEMPDNGGLINYSCQLNTMVDWSKVVAAAHTHPLYEGKHRVNRLNKYFSAGDPSILIVKEIPLYLRTPKGEKIKVLEIRNNWITTREIGQSEPGRFERWKARG